MINTTTYSAFWNYLNANSHAPKIYFFVKITDVNSNTFYYSNYHTHLSSYIPRHLIGVSTVVYKANLKAGNSTVSPVTVTFDNIQSPDTGATVKRFGDLLTTNELMTGQCDIYLGYDGITSTTALFPYYSGRIVNIRYDLLQFHFDVERVDGLELPQIPTDNYSENLVDDQFRGKPIPICFGRWYREADTTQYRPKVLIPAALVGENFLAASPYITLQVADHAIDQYGFAYIYDDNFLEAARISDTQTATLSTSQIKIDLGTYDSLNILTARIFYYPEIDGGSANGAVPVSSCTDGDYDTYTTIPGIFFGTPGQGAFRCKTRAMTPFPPQELYPGYGTETGGSVDGKASLGIASVAVELSGFPKASVSDDETTLDISITNTNWAMQFDKAAINLLSDVDNFNMVSSAASSSDGNLVISYAREWDGSALAFILDEDSTGGPNSYNIVPDSGNYRTMSEMAVEIEKQIQQSGCSNTYAVSYVKNKNKILVKRTSGSYDFRCRKSITYPTQSTELGFTNSSPGYETTDAFEPDGYTVLDIPDGDFSGVEFYVQWNCTSTDQNVDFYIKGIRLNVLRNYRQYSINPKAIERAQNQPPGWRSRLGLSIAGITQPLNDQRLAAARDAVRQARFFVTCDGHPHISSYYDTAPQIMQGIIAEYLGLTTARVDTGKVGEAHANSSGREMALYLAERRNCQDVFADMARFAGGFWHVTQLGRYAMYVMDPAYSSGDVNFTVQYREIVEPISKNLVFTRISTNEMATSLRLYYNYDFSKGDFASYVDVASASDLDIPAREETCPYITDDAVAATIADLQAETIGSGGLWGNPLAMIEFTTSYPLYQYAELGDIFQFSTDFNNIISCFQNQLADLYFVCIGKQYSDKVIKITLLETNTEV